MPLLYFIFSVLICKFPDDFNVENKGTGCPNNFVIIFWSEGFGRTLHHDHTPMTLDMIRVWRRVGPRERRPITSIFQKILFS